MAGNNKKEDVPLSPAALLHKSVSAFPSFSSALILPDGPEGAQIVVSASVRDLTRNCRRQLVTTLAASEGGKTVRPGFTSENSDGVGLTVAMKDGRSWVQLKSVDSKDKGKKYFVELWRSGMIVKSIEVTDSHGDFYTDDTFGSLALSACEKKAVYIAEAKAPDDKSPEKFVFKPDWGEKFTKKAAPRIVICDLQSEQVVVLEEQKDLAFGQVSFGPRDESLIFWGLSTHPRKYGILFCPNRRSGIYQSSLDGDNLMMLSSPDEAARSPRLDEKRETVFYLSNALGGPHYTCAMITAYSFGSKKTRVVLPYTETAKAAEFPGLFIDRLPVAAIVGSGDAQHIVSSTTWRSRKTIVAINVTSGSVTDLTPDAKSGSYSLIGLDIGWLVASRSSPAVPHEVHVGRLELSAKSAAVKLYVAHAPSPAPPSISWHTITYTERSDILEAILLKPEEPQAKTLLKGEKPPLLIFPHGGPHGAFMTEFYLSNYCLTRMGFAVAMVNYRGSIGFGQSGIGCLVGKVGTLDVEDTQYVAEQVCKSGEVDAKRVAIWGGSHGGFLTAWLVGRYPEYYKAAVLRNPVINMGSNLAQSDIPDWSLAEAGIEYDLDHPPLITPEIYSAIWKASPMSVAASVKTPSLVMLGADDRRVPNYEGKNWYYFLKSRGVDVRAMQFPENGHALDGVEAEKCGFEALANFFLEFV
ncbi:hypothetical protein HDU86_000460 [Geranomyces michiganensis]|nr:hypothetical protein HDU86_000460 [Geranomyces michiganensis]